MKSLRNQSVDRLFEAILSLKDKEDCYGFFEDICTVKELQDIAQRLDAAFLLDEGMSYNEISEKVGISSATIGRVSKCLNYGTGGYRLAIDNLKKSEESK